MPAPHLEKLSGVNIYGGDGTGSVQTVVYDLVALDCIARYRGPISVGGRILLSAREKHTAAEMGEGISLIEGSKGSCGSQKNWYTWLEKDSILRVVTVPLALKDEFAEAARVEGFEAKLVTPESNLLAELREEKSRLLTRLEQINEELSSLEHSSEEDDWSKVFRLNLGRSDSLSRALFR
ncbi:hypothetical protein QEH56_14550 [Pelagicoccus enzymogenes]|uniref:hypothetical protein n=1 Tax=Pelagicoccus enzymogenes TaxID=2773457 RepID=UPI00280E13BC|nr:hypothetical protein [Pelagicoccus enzymogenes]MDQ8199383.1 hypothetical protein [Pelagicoccus enzymogenes]